MPHGSTNKYSQIGIDYSMGTSNIDWDTNIHYGVIPCHNVEFWSETSEIYYDENEEEIDDEEDMCFEDRDPCGFVYNENGIEAHQSYDDSDIFITKSPFYTFAQFCSPCAPGACYLLNTVSADNKFNKAYCFPEDFFENGKCPYPVYRVKDNKLVYIPKE